MSTGATSSSASSSLLTALWLALLRPAVGLPVLGLLTLGLYFSYSQTSFVALFCAVLVVSLLAGDRLTRSVVVGVSAALVLAAGIVVLAEGDGDSTQQVTSDRITLVQVTWPVYAAHPVVGVGIGSQPLVSRRVEDAKKRKSKNVSHTTPLTVAAELGTIGLLVYLVFLAALGRAILEAWRRHRALGIALAGCLTALVVQSLFYGGFFEDPFVWGIAGRRGRRADVPAHASVRLGRRDRDRQRLGAVSRPVDRDERDAARGRCPGRLPGDAPDSRLQAAVARRSSCRRGAGGPARPRSSCSAPAPRPPS